MMASCFIWLVKALVCIFCVALGMAFFTLAERKVLGYFQSRKGPNKVIFKGLPQPLSDAAKLFIKENPNVYPTYKVLYIMGPLVSLAIALALWSLYPSCFNFSGVKFGVLFFICISSLSVYATLISGWASNSKYALVGALRAVAQTISYEVSMALILMAVLAVTVSFDFEEIYLSQDGLWSVMVLSGVFVGWMVIVLAETNRAPFDFAEGESELVSGFNIEYGSAEFVLLFLAEYISILFMSVLTGVLFLHAYFFGSSLFSALKVGLVALLFLWVRGSYPRMRYDTLMGFTWKGVLSLALGLLCVLMSGHFF